MRIGIAGAGVLGRLAAFQLSRAGHHVTVFESAPEQAPGPGRLRAAGWTAAGMLSPIAEMECGGPLVRDLGERSLTLWQSINEQLKVTSNAPAPLGLQLHDSLIVCHASDMGSAQRILRLLDNDPKKLIQLNANDVRQLAPEMKGTLHAWRLHGEGHLSPALAMQSLLAASLGVDWNWGNTVTQVSPHSIIANQIAHAFDLVLDTRGTGAAPEVSVRGVRGEVVVLHAPGFRLLRPVRLLHPRWRVYIVPHPEDRLVIGATEIESEDRSPISVQSTMELLSAAFSIFPALAEARIVHTDVNLRPATRDNLPYIAHEPGLLRINGLFRHGWLLAPAVLEKALGDAGLC